MMANEIAGRLVEEGAPVTMDVPDVGALVEYGLDCWGREPDRFRVSGWMRVAPPPVFADDVEGRICRELYEELRDPMAKPKMQWCLREEATHLSLSGIAGTIAPIGKCKVTGMVDWPPENLESARQCARRRGEIRLMMI